MAKANLNPTQDIGIMTLTTDCSVAEFHIGCCKENDDDANQTVTIDWGDGSKPKKIVFKTTDLESKKIKYKYADESTKTITITGNVKRFNCENAFENERENAGLKEIDLSRNPALIWLDCDGCKLTSLDVSKNVNLETLYCGYNQLKKLDVSKNIALTGLHCSNNELTSIDISKNTELVDLYCRENKITDIDISNNVKLKKFFGYINQLKNLDVSKNTSIEIVECSYSLLDAAALNALFETLHENKINCRVCIDGNPGTNDCDRSIAENKKWRFEL